MADLIIPGTATPADVLSGQSFSAGAHFDASGTMPNQGSPTFTPGASAITLPAGYYGGGTVDAASSVAGTASITSSTVMTLTFPRPVNHVYVGWAYNVNQYGPVSFNGTAPQASIGWLSSDDTADGVSYQAGAANVNYGGLGTSTVTCTLGGSYTWYGNLPNMVQGV